MTTRHRLVATLPIAWSLYGRKNAIPSRLSRCRGFPRFPPRPIRSPTLFNCDGLDLIAPNWRVVWVRMRGIKANPSSLVCLFGWLRVCVLRRHTAGGCCGWDRWARTGVDAPTPAAFGHLLQDSVARNVDMEWHGLEDRMEWRKQLEDPALLGLGARELLLERLR